MNALPVGAMQPQSEFVKKAWAPHAEYFQTVSGLPGLRGGA